MWSFTNIGKKNNKIIPARIDFDAAASIISVERCFWVAATVMYICPSDIKGMDFSDSGVTMPVICIFTSARSGSTFSKLDAKCNKIVTTIASTKPLHIAPDIWTDRTDCSQSPEFLICDIDGFGHNGFHEGCLASGEISASTLISLRT
jgi:hypothetical protein